MMKAQESTTYMLFLITELILVALTAVVVFKTLKDVNTEYEEKFISRDVALLMDSLTKNPVSIIYGFYRYDNEKAAEAYNKEFLGGEQGTDTFQSIAALSLLSGPMTAVVSTIITWGLGRIAVETFTEPTSKLEEYEITLTDETGRAYAGATKENTGEYHPYIEQNLQAQKIKSSLIRIIYEPSRLRVLPIEQKQLWNPYYKECGQTTFKPNTYTASEEMKKIAQTLAITPGIQGELSEQPKENTIILKTGNPGIRIYYTDNSTKEAACKLLNALTDKFSPYITGAAVMPATEETRKTLKEKTIIIETGNEETKLFNEQLKEATDAFKTLT